jgi:toxin ParE1/3/4
MKYVFYAAALTEYAEAIQYYAAQQPETEQAFVSPVDSWLLTIW